MSSASDSPDRLVMIYNAEDGFFNALNDWAHKFFSPETYHCHLCRYTYGVAGMLKPWKTFLEEQSFPTEFYYRPYFREAHPEYKDVDLPLILVEKNGQLDILLLPDEIEAAAGLESLIDVLRNRLKDWQPPAPPSSAIRTLPPSA